MRLGLMLNDPEEEHDCFSDNTHNSHYYDGLGVQNVYLGEYVRINGVLVSGPSLSDMVAATDTTLDVEMREKLSTTMMALGRIKTAADTGFKYDQMLERGNVAGKALIMGGVDGLVNQTRSIERAVSAQGLSQIAFEGSDSLDNSDAVFR
jgi:putative iron-regulated protein